MSEQTFNAVVHPKKFSLKSWWHIVLRVYKKMQRDNLSILAAGIAFYFLLALFPMLAAIISLYGLFVEPDILAEHMAKLTEIVPSDSRYILEEQISKVLKVNDSTLSTGFISGLLLSIYSAGKGATALITACNITYEEKQERGFFMALVVRLLLTLAIMFTVIGFLIFIIVMPIALNVIGGIDISERLINVITWPLLLLISSFLLASLYRLAPFRKSAKWRWVSPGAFIASLLWVGGSFAFNIYIARYATYNETYGSVGGIIILLMWFYLTAFVVLLGAEINAASELQTTKDTTVGPNSPTGERGAYVADNIGLEDGEK